MKLSIVILNYKTKDLTRESVRAILDMQLPFEHEIIVVDNGSRDGTGDLIKERFAEYVASQKVRFIQSDRNLGMGSGNNIGIRAAKGGYVLILNPDVVVLNDAIAKLLEFIQPNEKVGCVAPMLLEPNKDYQQSRYRFPTFLMFVYVRTSLLPGRAEKLRNYFMGDVPVNKPHKVDWVRGSALLLRKSVLGKIGGFDERFFIYMEDVDLCRKIWNAGYEVLYLPEAKMVHYYGRGSGALGHWRWLRDILRPLAWVHLASWMKYFWKWRKYNTN